MAQIANLESFAEGAVAERLNQELQKVLENIADPNTDAKKARKLTLTLTLKGNENRDVASVDIIAKTTLQPATPIVTSLVLDRDDHGHVIGKELKSGVKGQTYIDDQGDVADDTGNKIITFETTKSKQAGGSK